jgi:hypothetical protein
MTNNFTIRTWYRIMFVMLTAIGVITLLAWLGTAPLRQKNGFVRQFIYKVSPPIQFVKKDLWTWHICGVDNQFFYVQGRRPDQVIRISRDLQHTDTLSLRVPLNAELLSNFEISVDSSYIWVFAKNVPAVTRVRLDSPRVAEEKHYPHSNYTQAVKTSPSTLVFRGFDTSVHGADQIFLKGNFLTNNLQREQGISERHGDAGLSTAGLLHYDTTSHLLCYVFFYSNRFLGLDTNLNLVYRGNTIDTLHASQTQGGSVKSGRTISYTNITPSRLVNRANCVTGGKLFNYSQIKADNQTQRDYIQNAAIDVYDLASGKYTGSFYIPHYKGEKLQQLRVINDTMLVFYKHYMTIYKLQQ